MTNVIDAEVYFENLKALNGAVRENIRILNEMENKYIRKILEENRIRINTNRATMSRKWAANN